MACVYKYNGKNYSEEEFNDLVDNQFLNQSKTRVIYETQSDLFQKNRDNKILVNNTGKKLVHLDSSYDDIEEGLYEIDELTGQPTYPVIFKQSSENQFLQLLNKDNNWIRFFLQSIIQDSIKKGYEKILFPAGDTASKVEGHTTLEDFKRQKEDRIKHLLIVVDGAKTQLKNLKETLHNINNSGLQKGKFGYFTKNGKKFINYNSNFEDSMLSYKNNIEQIKQDIKNKEFDIEDYSKEINQLKEELKRVETEGFGALKPIYNFYENTVYNTLKKLYGKDNIVRITDEYGNDWYEIDITNQQIRSQSSNILLSKIEQSKFLQGLEKDMFIEQFFGEELEKSSNEILDAIISKDSNYLKSLAEKLKQYQNNNVPVKLMNQSDIEQYLKNTGQVNNIGIENSSGFYAPKTNEIIINSDKISNKLPETLLHEIIHAHTFYFLNKNEGFAKEWKKLFKISKEFFSEEEKDNIYQLSDEHEFLTGVFTNVNFIKKLQSKPSLNKEYSNLFEEVWNSLKDIISRIFNLNTVQRSLLDDVFALATNVIVEAGESQNINTNSDLGKVLPSQETRDEIEEISEDLLTSEDQKIITTIEDFYDVTKSRLNKLIKNKNYSKLKELFTTADGINRYDSQADLLKAATKASNDAEGMKRKTRAIAIGIIQTQQFTDAIYEDVKEIISDKESAFKNITTLQYYLYTLNDWKAFLEDTKKIFEENPVTVAKINNILGRINAINEVILKNDVTGLVQAFKPLLEPASKQYIDKELKTQVEKYNNLKNKTKDSEKKKEYEKIVKELENKIKKYDFSVDKNIENILTGKEGDINMFSYLGEAYSDNPDAITSGFTIWLKNNLQDVNAEVNTINLDYEKELAPLYEKLGNRFNPETLGSQLTFDDSRIDYDSNEYKVKSLLNPFKDYQRDNQTFINTINEIQDLVRNGENIEENTEKLIATKKEYAKWRLNFMHQEFIPEFYEKYELWDDEIGQELKEQVDEIFDKIRQIQTSAIALGSELSDTELMEIEGLYKDYTLLGNLNDYENNPKTGRELEKAQRMREIRALNRELYDFIDNTAAFEKAKQRHSEYIISTGIAEDSSEYLQEMQNWEDNNTRTVIKQEFYDLREEITTEISDLLSIYKTDEDNTDFQENWEEIMGLLYGHRDEDNQPIGTEINNKGAERIKEATIRLEEIKNSISDASGLSKNEQTRLSELVEKAKDKSISDAERNELKALFEKQKSNGLSETSKKRLFELFEELKELQSRIPTEYYVNMFNSKSQELGVTVDDSGNIKEIKDGVEQIVPILESSKLYDLLENETFKAWFELNHIQVEKWNRETNSPEMQWQRLYHWNRIVPNNPDHIEIKPSRKYSTRVVKDKFKTRQIIGETIDNKGNYLPRLDVNNSLYINQEYFRLKNSTNEKDKTLFKMLEIHTKYLLNGQEGLPNRNKLYLDLPRLRKSATERNTKIFKELISKPSDIPSTIWNGIKSKIESYTDANEDNGNFKSVFADKYGNEYTSVPIKYTNKLDIEDVSLDIHKAVIKYTYSAKLHEKLLNLLPVSNALERVLKNPDFQPVDTSKTIKGRLSKFLHPKTGGNRRASAIQNINKRIFEGQEKKMELGERTETIIGSLKGLTVIKTIAYDIPASVANVVNGTVQNLINGSDGYISHKNLGKAHNVFFTTWIPAFQKDYWENKIGEKSLQSQLFDLYGFVQSESFEETLGEKISQSKIKDFLALNWLKNHREWGEIFLQTVNGIAYLDATMIAQGQNTISLLDAYELDENGKIKLRDNISKEWDFNGSKFKALKERIEYHNIRVHGNYSKNIDKPEIETYTTFNTMMMMKRFFVSMFLNRFAASDLQLTKYGLKSKARFNTRVGLEHGYYIKTLNLFAEELESKLQTGEWQSLSPEDKIALTKTTLDIGILVLAWALMRFMFGFDPDDEDKYKKLKKKSWIENQLIYQTARLMTETSTFLNPEQYGEFIAGSPVVWSTLKTWLELIKYTLSQEEYKKDSGLYKKGESKAKARLYKATGIEKVMKAGDDNDMTIQYLKLRER